MTEETDLGLGQGDAPVPPPLPAATGWELARRPALTAPGGGMGEAGETQSVRDSLTGAYSRASLHDRLRQEVDRARRYSLPLSILVLDLDHFKSINDAFGHTRGDKVLIDFTARTHGLVRDSDLLFRYGGDEFVLLLPHTDSAQALNFAGRLIESIHGVPFAGVPPLSVTLSIGSASFPSDGQSAEDLFESADRRLYEAKRQGRARVVAEDPVALGPSTFEVDARLLERELPLSALRHFLDSLPEHKRGLFTIGGPRGVGKTGFLLEVAKAARLRGYAVWVLHARAAMRNRLYGALAEAAPPASGLPPPAASETLFIQALQRDLVEQGQAGLLVAVDRLAELDTATLELLRQMLILPDLGVVAIAYTLDAAGPRRAALLEASLRTQVELEPLTPQGVRLWVRTVLRWEPPASFCDWLHAQTQGLPGLISQALHYLLDRNVLQASHDTWQLAPGFENLPLAGVLQRRQFAPPQNLPAAPTGFVGRQEELQDVKRLLRQARAVVLAGPGGVGKSRLAVQAAAEMADYFTDGQFFVPLEGTQSPGFVISAVANALGLELGSTEDAHTQVLHYLRDRSVLLILDDFAANDDAEALVAALVSQAPGVRLLITARAPMELPASTTYDLLGLPVPPVEGARGTGQASHYSAEQLFVQGAQRAAPDFVLTDEDRLYVRRICQLVEGLPLGIELAAAWAPLFRVREIAAQLESSLDLLVAANLDVPLHQRSARAVLDYFWHLLADDERRRLLWLSVFRGGFDGEAARQVTGASLFFLSALVDKAFVRKRGSGRYLIHELMREYAEARLLADPTQHRQAQDAHCDYYAALLARFRASVKGQSQVAGLADLRMEVGNIRAAWQWAAQTGRASAISQAFETLVHFYLSEQWFQEGAQTFTQALERWKAHHPAVPADMTVAQLAAGRGVFLNRLGQNDAALAALEESLAHVRAAAADPQHHAQLAFTLYHLGLVLNDYGEYLQAQAVLRESLGLARALDDQHGVALALNSLAGLAFDLGDYPEARRLYRDSLQLRRTAGDQHGMVITLSQLGSVAIELGEYREAQDALQEAASLAESLGLAWGEALGKRNLGWLALTRGEYPAARDSFGASLAYSRSTGNRKDIGADCFGLAGVAQQTGDLAEARRLYHEACNLFHASGYQRGLAMALTGLGEVALAAEPASASVLLHEALVTALRIRALPCVLATLVGLAALQVRAGEHEKAVELLTFALYHPASNRRTQNQAARALSRLEGELPGPQVAVAEDRGRRMALDPHAALLIAQRWVEGQAGSTSPPSPPAGQGAA